MSARAPIFAALLALSARSAPVRAEVMAGGLFGLARGTLERESAEAIEATSMQGFLGWSFGEINAHGFFQSLALAYAAGGQTYDGVYTLSGVGAGYGKDIVFLKKPGRISAMAQVPLSGTYTVLTESGGTFNGQRYLHSALTTLSGGVGVQVLAGYDALVIGRGGKKDWRGTKKAGANLYLGLYLGYLRQSFDSQSTRIRTNNSVLAPPSPGTESVDYGVSAFTLSMAMNYDL